MKLRRGPAFYLGSSIVALALGAVLTGCGGGGDDGTPQVASSLGSTKAPAGRKQALSTPGTQATVNAIANPTAADLFDWAQWKWPDLFPTAPVQVEKDLAGNHYVIRAYASGIFLAVGTTNGEIYALLPTPEAPLISLGNISNFAAEISADSCTFRPGSCNPPPPAGTYNECVDPAMLALPTGSRLELVYQYAGLITGEQTTVTEIMGPATFEGQAAILSKSSTEGSSTSDEGTINSSTEIATYLQIVENGLLDTIGSTIKATTTMAGIPFPFVTESKSTFSPPMRNVEFTLQEGQSATRTISTTTTVLAGPGQGTQTTLTLTETDTFVARESVNVLGRTFDTCKYTSVTEGDPDVTTTWFMVGKGVAVKIVSPGQTVELKSATYNGQAL